MSDPVPHTSWSEIDTIRHCLRKHDLKYKQGWTQIHSHPAAELGTKWHEMLDGLYTTGEPDAPIELLKQWREEEPGAEQYDTLAWMLDGYYQQWGLGDPLWAGNIELVEMEFLVPLPDVGYGPLNLKGYIDLGVRVAGKLWVVDHKTGAAPPNDRDLDLADQWTLYVWALRQQGYDVFGSMHNYVKTAKLKREQTLKERFSRTPIHRTDREVEEVVYEATLQAWLGKIDNGAPRSPGEMCFRRCGFHDACVSDRRFGGKLSEGVLQVNHYQKER